MANSKNALDLGATASQPDQGPEADMAEASLSYFQSFRLGSRPRISSNDSIELPVSAANAEVTMAFVHLDQRRDAVSGRWVASKPSMVGLLRGQSDRWPCFCGRTDGRAPADRYLRAWRLRSAPGSQVRGQLGPGRCPCVCVDLTADSSTGLCYVRDGLACSQTGCCSQ